MSTDTFSAGSLDDSKLSYRRIRLATSVVLWGVVALVALFLPGYSYGGPLGSRSLMSPGAGFVGPFLLTPLALALLASLVYLVVRDQRLHSVVGGLAVLAGALGLALTIPATADLARFSQQIEFTLLTELVAQVALIVVGLGALAVGDGVPRHPSRALAASNGEDRPFDILTRL